MKRFSASVTLVLSLLLVWSVMQPLAAQEKTAAKLAEFETAAIRPIDPKQGHSTGIDVYPGGRVVISGLPLKSLVAAAFHLSYWQISGGDPWTANDVYRVEGKPAESTNITNLKHGLFDIEDEQLREMLQALLIDRFQLKFHRETRTGDVYLLIRTGKELRLRPVDSANPRAVRGVSSVGYAGGRWNIDTTTMPQLAQFASNNILHTVIIDRTELTGPYDYRQGQPDVDPIYGGDNRDSFLRFVQELGLKLERTKGPIEAFVIDMAAKPSPN